MNQQSIIYDIEHLTTPTPYSMSLATLRNSPLACEPTSTLSNRTGWKGPRIKKKEEKQRKKKKTIHQQNIGMNILHYDYMGNNSNLYYHIPEYMFQVGQAPTRKD